MHIKAIIAVTLMTISSLTGCKGHYELTDQQKQLADTLKGVTQNYLVENFGGSAFGGKPFCAYKVLDVEVNDENTLIKEYLFVTCQEYHLNNGGLEKGSGTSFPVALSIQRDSQYKITSHQIPRDGSMNSSDIENIFPKRTHEEIYSDEIRSNLLDQTKKEAEDYFKR